MTALATAGGWPRLQRFSPLLYREFAATPTTIERVTKLAKAIGFPPDHMVEASR